MRNVPTLAAPNPHKWARFRELVFNTKTPHSVNTFLVDGRVADTWAFEGGHVRLDAFEPLPRAA